MEFQAEVTAKDFADFNFYYLQRHKLRRMITMNAIMSVLLTYLFLQSKPGWGALDALTAFAMYFVTFSLVGAVFMFLWVTLYTRFAGTSKNGVMTGLKKFKLSDNGIEESSDKATMFVQWTGVLEMKTNRKAHYLFVDKMAAFIIPKSAFQNAAQEKQFLDFVGQRISAKASG